MVSGKRVQQNRLAKYTDKEARERFKSADGPEQNVTLSDFAQALAFAVSSMAAHLLLDSKIAWLSSTGKDLEPAKIRRLAAFLAWWVVNIYQDDCRKAAQDTRAGADTLKEWVVVTAKICETMYPPDDLATEAIAAYKDAEHRMIETNLDIVIHREIDAVRAVLGLPAAEISMKAYHEHFTVVGIFVGYRYMLGGVFETLQTLSQRT